MNNTETDALLAFASDLANEAGVIMRNYFHGIDQQASLKQDSTVVTIADTQINALVIKRVRETYPDHGVLGEEASMMSGRTKLWVCDPIDGTNGFTIGEPTAVFSLAFVVDGVPEVAVVHDPFQRRTITAIKGRGAFCGDQQLHVSQRPYAQAIVAAGGSFSELDRSIELYRVMATQGVSVRMLGGLVFKGALIAEGKIDGVIFPYTTAHDIAAVKLIIEEAGGKVTDLDSTEQRYDQPIRGALLSNGVIHDHLASLVRDYGVDDFLLPKQ
jgi:fructose-1,6-bisphosphatase/inositol monophosphatase family enzyme